MYRHAIQYIYKLICTDIPNVRLGYNTITNRSLFSKPKQNTPKGNMYDVDCKLFNPVCRDCYVSTTAYKFYIKMISI